MLGAFMLLATCGCGNSAPEPSLSEIERGMKESFVRQANAFSVSLDAKAKKIGNGRWSVKMTVERNGERRSLNATAVMDANGGIHYYTE